MYSYRRWLYVLSLMLLIAVVAACAPIVTPAAAPAAETGGETAEEAASTQEESETAEEAEAAMDLAGSEITATYMQAGTYDKAAEAIQPGFEADTGI
jgi:hypothetical protein